MPKKETHRIFVYGTLMRGERAHSYLADAKFVGEYCLKDYALYNLGWYPGIRAKKGNKVFGEVYEISADKLPGMDAYEGEGHLYRRTPVVVENENGRIDVQAYVYTHEIFGGIIKGGNWKTRGGDCGKMG